MTTTPGSAPAIEFCDVVKRFGDNVVLDGLSFSVAQGDRVTLIGPSGSGKTTILRLLMTLEEADGGIILVDGDPYTHEMRGGKRVPIPEKRRRTVRRRVGMVFQQFNLFPNMSVLENIVEAPVHVLGLSRAQATVRAEELLEQVGLADKRDARCTQLSGGQQQRVAIARALVTRPDVVVADEPTGALDTRTSKHVLELLRFLVDTLGQSVFMVTHDPVAASFADRVVFLADGQVAGDLVRPTPEQVADRMTHLGEW